jgi:SAM-dependent methyltransferase
MNVVIPMLFDEIVDEIVRFTDISREQVKVRLWNEAISLGWNVMEDVKYFNVTPHKYDDYMDQLYQDSYGFIFETMVFWVTPLRQKWIAQALERINLYSQKNRINRADVRILMLGDGAGNDSLYLVNHGFTVHYFDIPGSKTYDFATKRFNYYNVAGEHILLLSDYESLFNNHYDSIVCFEVLEHLPDPKSLVRDIGKLLKINGIALITEAFKALDENLPTHLDANLNYAGLTPLLFSKERLSLAWYSKNPLFKPFEFVKTEVNHKFYIINFLKDWNLMRNFIAGRKRCWLQKIQQ